MQVTRQKYFMDRCLYYITLPIQNQAQKGDDWQYRLRPSYIITLLDFDIWENDSECINWHSLMNEQTHEIISENLKFITVELPKFNKTLEELSTDLDCWLFCFNHLNDLKEQPPELKGEIFDELFRLLDTRNLTYEEMETYEKSITEYSGVRMAMEYSQELGYEKGRKEGIERGVEKGIEKGLMFRTFEIAKEMQKKGMAIQLISDLTGLTFEQIQQL
jgi:predicted transposase/invertase (TIGR01784 family)